jgi:hypothetical protein
VELADLEHLFLRAKESTGHTEFVVMGSLAILALIGKAKSIPRHMTWSRDVDAYTRADPERVFELAAELGEGSAFDRKHGFFLDPVSPMLPTFPANWEYRLVQVPFSSGIRIFFVEANDVAVSKYARCEPRDRRWIQAGLQAGLLSPAVLESRMRETVFLDDAERERAWLAFDEDRARLA